MLPVTFADAQTCRWDWVNPQPHGQSYHDSISIDGELIAVGDGGMIARSSSPGVWTQVDSGTTEGLYGIASNGTTMVVVGTSGQVLTSSDGLQWRAEPSPVNLHLRSVTWGQGLFVAVGEDGVIMASPDGSSWQITNLTWGDGYLWDVVHDGSLFVAVGNNLIVNGSTTRGAVYTSPDGVTWTGHNLSNTSGRRALAVTATDTGFVMAGHAGLIMLSDDAVTWTRVDTDISEPLFEIIWTGEELVACGDGIYLSSDGSTWETDPFVPPSTVLAATASGAELTAFGESGLIIARQLDQSWTVHSEPSGPTANITSICPTDFGYIAVGEWGSVATSADGSTWIPHDQISRGHIIDVEWNGTAAFASEEGTIWTSSNGVEWSKIEDSPYRGLQDLLWDGEKLLGVSYYGGIWSSTDGLSWSYLTESRIGFVVSGDEVRIRAKRLAVAGSTIVVVGDLYDSDYVGAVAVSLDGGVTLELALPSFSTYYVYQMTDVATNGETFVVVGTYGQILVSHDGLNWRRIYVTARGDLHTVTWTGSRFIAAGESGQLLSSVDGEIWIAEETASKADLNASLSAGGKVLVAGDDGAILERQCTGPAESPVAAFSWSTTQLSGSPMIRFSDESTGEPLAWHWDFGDGRTIDDAEPSHSYSANGTYSVSLTVANHHGASTSSAEVVVEGIDSGCLAPQWSLPANGSARLKAVTIGDDRVVAVGYGGSAAVSSNGETWTHLMTGTWKELNGVCWNGEQFIAVGDQGAIVSSPDGVSWTVIPAVVSADLYSVTSTGSVTVAVGSSGTIVASTDGHEWHTAAIDTLYSINDVAWSGTHLVAVGGLTRRPSLILTSDDGFEWDHIDTVGLSVTGSLANLVWTGNEFATLAASTLLTSSDGRIWESTRGQEGSFDDLIWAKERFIGIKRGLVWISDDGTSWQSGKLAGENKYNGLAFGNDRIIAVGLNGAVATSDDGRIWSESHRSDPGSQSYLNDVAWDGERFWAVGDSGVIVSQPDLSTWRSHISGTSFDLNAITSTGELLVAVGDNSTITVSDDGSEWTPIDTPFSGGLKAIAGNGSLLVTVGTRGVVATSNDGYVWSSATVSDSDLQAVIWDGGRFVVVGQDGLLATSSDGAEWTVLDVGQASSLNDLIHTHSLYVAVGDNGAILSSPDGEVWSNHESGTTATLRAVASNGVRIIATGSDGELLTSIDGLHWSPLSTPLSQVEDLQAVAWNGSRFLTVGRWYAAHTSSDGLTWSDRTRPQHEPRIEAVATNGSVYVAVGWGLHTSEDGVIWESHPDVSYLDYDLRDIVWSGERFVAIGRSGVQSVALISTDGESWETIVLESTVGFVAAGGGKLVAGWSSILLSDNGTDWTETHRFQVGGLTDVAWNGSLFVGVGISGLIASSTDGAEWVLRRYGSANLTDVVYDGTRFIACSIESPSLGNWQGKILTSSDGIIWEEHEIGVPGGITGLTLAGDGLVALGPQAIVHSRDGISWAIATQAPPGGGLLVDQGRLMVFGYGLYRLSCNESPAIQAPGAFVSVVPAAAHVAGEAGTSWRTDLVLHNQNATETRANLYLLAQGADNSGAAGVPVTVPAGGSVAVDDLLASTFSAGDAVGGVLIGSTLPLQASSRTYNDTPDGTYGQYIPVSPLGNAIGAHTEVVLIQLSHNQDYRTNLGVANAGPDPLEVRASLYDAATGAWIGSPTYNLPAFGWQQDNNVLAKASATVDDAYAVLSASQPEARYFAYASVVDNRSGDPVYITPAVARDDLLYIPAAAHVEGSNLTRWRSDLEVVNLSSFDAIYSVDLLGSKPWGRPETQTFELAAGEAVRYHDVVQEMFATEGSGAMRLTLQAGSLLASSRTYNDLDTGTYGQYIPAFAETDAILEGATGLLLQLAGSADGSSGYRTNIGLVNAAEVEITVEVSLFSADGAPLGTMSVDLAQATFRQLNDVFGEGDIPLAFATVTSDTPGARFFAYASVIDNRSGDPVFIPAQ
jgi:PKD repeat protein